MWTSRMRVYLRYVDTLIDLNDEAKDALALHLIQRAVDDILMQKIGVVKTSKEALKILEAQFSETGSCLVADEEDDEMVIEASVSEAEHDQEACRESHNAVKHVDDENNEAHCAEPQVDGADEDEVAIAAAESVEATRVVAGHPVEAEKEAATAAQVVEEELLESKPNRAGTERTQPVTAEEIDENDMLTPLSNYEAFEYAEIFEFFENIPVVDSIAIAENELDEGFEDCNFISEFDKIIESCMEDKICSEDAEEDEDDTAESIFIKWSPEEIRHYYELMWQQATEEDESAIKAENSMFPHADMKTEFTSQEFQGIMNQIKDEHIWQHAIDQLEEQKKKVKMKKNRFMKNRAKKKMRKTRKVPEFRVWSRRKKKKLHSEQQAKQILVMYA